MLQSQLTEVNDDALTDDESADDDVLFWTDRRKDDSLWLETSILPKPLSSLSVSVSLTSLNSSSSSSNISVSLTTSSTSSLSTTLVFF